MRQNGHSLAKSGGAAWRRWLAFACLAVALAGPAQAQDAPLPSVNDYRLPSGTSTPRARPAGPVDPADPAAAAPRVVRPAEPEPSAAAPSASPSPRTSAPAAARPSPAARPAATAAAALTAPAATSARPAAAPASAAPQIAASPSPAAAAETPSGTVPESPAAVPSAPPVQWNVHSAREAVSGMPAWLIGLAFLGGAVLALMTQAAWRRRRQARLAQQAELESWELAEVAAPAPEAPVMPVAPVAQVLAPVAPASYAEHLSELDLITVLAEPDAPAPAPDQPVQPPSRPELNLLVNPLQVELAARRMSATLMNAVLNYELIVRNTGSVAIGPVIVGGDMIGAHASLPDRAQLELSGNAIAPLHQLPHLAAGESATLSGEFKLPLSAITPIRSGNAALFIPLARFRVEASRKGAPPLVANSAFVIGENQDRPGAALKPFRLDLGPRLYSQIGQRELAMSA